MPRPRVYLRRLRADRIEEEQQRAIERGTLHRKVVKDHTGNDAEVWRNRTLIQACEWRIETKKASKKNVLAELKERLKWTPGRREIAMLEKAIAHFSPRGA